MIHIHIEFKHIKIFTKKIYHGTVLAFDYSKHLRQPEKEVGIEQRGTDHNQGLNEQ
jgi:hypothetical protein